jgi:hypothetical protein
METILFKSWRQILHLKIYWQLLSLDAYSVDWTSCTKITISLYEQGNEEGWKCHRYVCPQCLKRMNNLKRAIDPQVR